MNAYHLLDQTGPDALRLVKLPDPKPARSQVLVRVRATSLNYRDLMVADGRYGKASLPLIPLSDGAGEIASLGRLPVDIPVAVDQIYADKGWKNWSDWLGADRTRQTSRPEK